MPRVTMKDIAQVMGVSVMTVSNAFNRPDQLSAELRERILQRAEKMGYTGPSAAARHLRSGRTNTYGVIFSAQLSYAFSDPFSVIWLTAFTRVMEAQQANVLLLSIPPQEFEGKEAIQNASVDGVAGLCLDQSKIQYAQARGLPTVLSCLSGVPDSTEIGPYVLIDDHQAGLDIAEHVRKLGHERIDVLISDVPDRSPTIAGPEAYAENLAWGKTQLLDTWARLRGILEGLEGAQVRVINVAENIRDLARIASTHILDQRDRPTAVVASSDILALGFMDACADRGVVPGRDISVTGFDDLPDAAPAGLTTIRQPIAERGRLSAELLLDPERQPRHIVLPHELIVRATSQPVR